MNAIISLCHFCDLHGPSILFSTQAFHSSNPDQTEDELLEDRIDEHSFPLFKRQQSKCSNTSSNKVITNPDETDKAASTSTLVKTSDTCEACTSFGCGHQGYISYDHEAHIEYISTQHPDHQQVFSMVRQACVRSLSCEVCPGKEGPIFFGDDTKGHVLSHTFFLKDNYARGFQRWFSIIVVMMDKIYLLNSWPFLVKHLRGIIDELQNKASVVCEDEQMRFPQRSYRLSSVNLTSHNLRLPRGANKPARSVIELVRDKHFFQKLHRQFVWVLKAGGNRLTERLMEGPPTEDSIIDMEKQEETEEGFVILFSKKEVTREKSDEGDVPFQALEYDEESPVFENLRHLLKVLDYPDFHNVAHHVVIGNQVIVRGHQRKLIRSIIDCLKQLLPKGCCRTIYYSMSHEDSWRCNFLGLAPNVELPAYADHYVLIDIQQGASAQGEEAAASRQLGRQLSIPCDFEDFTFTVQSTTPLSDKGPSVLTKMEFMLLNDTLANSVVEHCLVCLKEEWMNKVKVLFTFTKAGGSRCEAETRRLLMVVGAQDEDRMVLKFWMDGLSVQYRNYMLSSAIQGHVSSP